MTPFQHISNYRLRMRAIAARAHYWMRRNVGLQLVENNPR